MPSAQQTPRRPSLIIIHNSTSKKDLRSPLSPKSPRSTTTTTFVSMISPTKIEVRQSRRFSTVSERTLTKNGRMPLPVHRRTESIVIKNEKDYNDRSKVMSPSAGPATTTEDTFPASTFIPSDPLSLPASRDRRNSLSCVVLCKEAKGSVRGPPSCRTPGLGGPRPNRRASIVVLHNNSARSTLTDESESEDEDWKKDIGKIQPSRDSTDSYTWSVTRL